jgi:hypothetical protein
MKRTFSIFSFPALTLMFTAAFYSSADARSDGIATDAVYSHTAGGVNSDIPDRKGCLRHGVYSSSSLTPKNTHREVL